MSVEKATGFLTAAHLAHERADALRVQGNPRRWSNAQVADLIDDLADRLKREAVSARDQ